MPRTSRPRALLLVLLAAVLLVAGGNLAAQASSAAAGQDKPVLAGKVTKTGKLTTLQRTRKGPALSLRTKASSPPLAVTSTKKVAKLNADRLDGRHADALQTRTYAYQLPTGGSPTSSRSAVFPGLPDGAYLVNFAVTLDAESVLSSAQCFLRQAGDPKVIGLAYATTKSSFATSSSVGVFNTANGAIGLVCTASSPFVFDDTDTRGVVTFTRTDLVERDATAPVTRPARASGGAGTATGR